jgi:hypothetical protein
LSIKNGFVLVVSVSIILFPVVLNTQPPNPPPSLQSH